MKNWRTTIGGAIGTLGTALAGVGVLGQFTEAPTDSKTLLWYTAFAGFLLGAFGKFFTSLFAADAKVLSDVVKQTNANSNDIAAVKSDTSFTTKP